MNYLTIDFFYIGDYQIELVEREIVDRSEVWSVKIRSFGEYTKLPLMQGTILELKFKGIGVLEDVVNNGYSEVSFNAEIIESLSPSISKEDVDFFNFYKPGKNHISAPLVDGWGQPYRMPDDLLVQLSRFFNK